MLNINEYDSYHQMMSHFINIKDSSDINDDLEKALHLYNGQYHAFLHSQLINDMDSLPYPAILLLGTTLETPWTSDTLEVQVKALALIMKETHWDGTAKMLTETFNWESLINDPYLDGYIIEYFALSQRTPQDVITNAEHYISDGDTLLLRGYLVTIYGWLCRGPFDEKARDFLNELNNLMAKTQDVSIKQQITEIFEANEPC